MNRRTAGQYMIHYLLCIFQDFSKLFIGRLLKDPCFTFTYANARGRTDIWTHSWNADGLYVKVCGDKLQKDILIRNMIHIFIHAYNKENGISDMSETAGGRFHKKSYAETVQQFGMEYYYHNNHGYQIGEIPEEIYEKCMEIIEQYYDSIQTYLKHYNAYGANSLQLKKRNTYVMYQCPVCKEKIRGTGNLDIICARDSCAFELI